MGNKFPVVMAIVALAMAAFTATTVFFPREAKEGEKMYHRADVELMADCALRCGSGAPSKILLDASSFKTAFKIICVCD